MSILEDENANEVRSKVKPPRPRPAPGLSVTVPVTFGDPVFPKLAPKHPKTVVLRLCSKSVKPYGKFMPADVWTLNDCFFPDSTRHFQLHSFYEMNRAHGPEYFKKLSKLDVPLVLFPREEEEWSEAYSRKLRGVIHPVDESFVEGLPLPPGGIIQYPAIEAVTLACRAYFDNSVNWLMAMAVLEGYERIVLTGISFGDSKEQLWRVRRMAASMLEDFLNTGKIGEDYWGGDEKKKEKLLLAMVDDLRGMFGGDESWAVPAASYHAGVAAGHGVEVIAHGDTTGLFYDRWSPDDKPALYGMHPDSGGRHGWKNEASQPTATFSEASKPKKGD